MSRFLVLETGGAMGQVAIADENSIIDCIDLPGVRSHAKELVPSIKSLLGKHGWEPGSLDAIFVNNGPGSYTSLRVGLITVKTMAFVNGAKVVCADCMECMISRNPKACQSVDIIVDAQMGSIYFQRFNYESTSNEFVTSSKIAILPFDQWVSQLETDHYIMGPALTRYATQLPENMETDASDRCHPTCEDVYRVAVRKWKQNIYEDIYMLEPLYLRRSSAEINWDKRKKEKSS